MAERPQRIIRRRPEPAEEIVDDDDVEEVEAPRKPRRVVEPEDEEPTPVKKAAKPAPAPAPVKKAAKPAPEPEDDDDDLYEEGDGEPAEYDDDDEPEPTPVRKAAPAKPAPKTAPKKVVEEEPEEYEQDKLPFPAKKAAAPIAVKKVDTLVAGEILVGLVENLEDMTKELVFTKIGDGKYSFVVRERKPDKPKAVGKEFWDEVLSPEFLEWSKEWTPLTFAEKKKRAVKAGATWDAHKDPRVEVMRITEAYRDAMGIEKYKPQ